ncbi:FMRFamide receptor-like [Elysia marginata]|uniref:FMRFamide receptor-like n=1 Tax=Elysia marginata TaxID=1093978 RepID=A0AAV4G468_9GAST|nr:FMRFamide receptor-like [Elysia marginata]
MKDMNVTLLSSMKTTVTTASFHSNDNNNNSDLPFCPELRDENEDESYKQFYLNAQLVTGLFIYPSICFPGLLCNALSVYVLTRKNMLTSTNAFLSALAVADSIKLLNDILYFLVIVFMHTSPKLGNLSYGYLYPYSHFVFNLSLCVSAWLTVSVAVERYILVCHPTKARAVWSRRRAVTLCLLTYFTMTCLALPSALRYRTIRCLQRETLQWRLEVELTEMWQNKTFVVVYTWIQNLMRSIIPLIVLIILNTRIVWALRKTRTKRRKTSRHRVTVMMIVVILTFLVCITPDAILSTVFGFGYHEAGYLVKGIREITDTLLGLNAGVNFLIYCAFNKVFRKRCARLCCYRVPQTGWFTEMDESTYRRLSEAKSVLITNNNSPSRQGRAYDRNNEKTSPDHQVSHSLRKASVNQDYRGQVSPVSQHNAQDRTVRVYLPANIDDKACPNTASLYHKPAGEDEYQNLVQEHCTSCKSNPVSSVRMLRKTHESQELDTIGHLISASLSLPSLPKLLQGVENSFTTDLSSETPKYSRESHISDIQFKSLSQPSLPVLHDKYEIPVCFCSSRPHAQSHNSTSLTHNYTDLLQNASDQGERNVSSFLSHTTFTDDTAHQKPTKSHQHRPRSRPSSSGLKKSKNSVKSKRASRMKSSLPTVCSDSEGGQSESSMSTEIYDNVTRDSYSSSSTDEIPRRHFTNNHQNNIIDKKSKRSRFMPPCIEGVRSKNANVIDGSKNSRCGFIPEVNATNLKNCGVSSLTHSVPNLKSCNVSSLPSDTISAEDASHYIFKAILSSAKLKSCQGSSFANKTPKHGRGPVVRFQDTVT